MATQLGEAFVILKGDDTRLKGDLAKAKTDVTQATNAMKRDAEKLGHALGKAAAGLALAASAWAAIGIRAAVMHEDASMNLAGALARTGDATKTNIDAFQTYATRLQETTVYSETAVTQLMAQIKNFEVHTSQLEDATTAAVGLAAVYRLDLVTAGRLVGQAYQGNTSALKTYGIEIDQTGTKAQKFAALLAKGIPGLKKAELDARGASGQFRQLQNAINSAAAQMGTLLLPVMKMFVGVMKPIVGWVQALPTPIKATGLAIGFVALAVAGVVGSILKIVAAYKLLTTAASKAAIASIWAWAKGHPAVAAAAVAGFLTAMGGAVYKISKLYDDSIADTEDYLKEMNRLMKQGAGLQLDVGPPVPETDAQIGVITGTVETLTDKYGEQLERVKEIYKNLQDAREEEEQRQRAAIGWMGASDLWRNAAVAGAQARFTKQETPEPFWVGGPIANREQQMEGPLLSKALQMAGQELEISRQKLGIDKLILAELHRMNMNLGGAAAL